MLDLNGHTIDLNNVGFAGIIIDSNVKNVAIINGRIINSSKPPAPLAGISQLNFLIYNPPTAQGFGIAINANTNNLLFKDIVTDRCFVGIGTLDGNISNVQLEQCEMYNFGFDFGPLANNFRGAGFSFTSPTASTTPTTRINSINFIDCVADSLTGLFAFALRAVMNSNIINCFARVGFNLPQTPVGALEANVEETRGFGILGCEAIVLRNCHTNLCRNAIAIQQSASCIAINCHVQEWTRQAFSLNNAPFPLPSGGQALISPLNGLPSQNNSFIDCTAKTNITNPNPPDVTNGQDRGVGFFFSGAFNNILDHCEASGIVATGGLFNAGLLFFSPILPGVPSQGNIIRNCIFNGNNVGILSTATGATSHIRNHFINNVIDNNTTQGVADSSAANANVYERNTANFNGPTNSLTDNYSQPAVRPVVSTTDPLNTFTPIAPYVNTTNGVGMNVP